MKEMMLKITHFNPENFESQKALIGHFRLTDFLEEDICGILLAKKRHAKLVNIINHEGTKDEQIDSIVKDVIEKYDDENTIIFTSAYISKVEFPEKDYYIDNLRETTDLDREKKSPIDVEGILNSGSELLESIGFIDVNRYVKYEYKVAFIYGNSLGKEVSEELLKLV